jgi:hypothetical protein
MQFLAIEDRRYLAVLGDIKRSRTIIDRELAQRVFLGVIEDINTRLKAELAVPITVSRGDEFQGLLAAPEAVLTVVNAFDSRTNLIAFRYGLGWGPVGTAFRDRTTEMDGACFQHAYAALERGKKEGRWLTFAGAPADGAQALNAVFRLIQVIRDGWTRKQKAAVTERRVADTLIAAAGKLGIDKSTLSKMLKAAHYAQLLEAEEAVRVLLRHHLVQPTGGDGS